MKKILCGLLLALGLAAFFSVTAQAAQYTYKVRTEHHGSLNFPDSITIDDYSLVMEDVDGYRPNPVIIEYLYAAGEGTNLRPSEYKEGKVISSIVYCFYSKSDGTYRPFRDETVSEAADGFVSYKNMHFFQNGMDMNKTESESVGAFMSVYYDNRSSMDIPVLHVPYSERNNIEQILADYFINGGSSSYVVNGQDGKYPPLSDDNTVFDEHLGYLRNCRIHYWKDEKEPDSKDLAFSDEEYINERYDFTWDYVPSTGAAGEVDWDDGLDMGDLVNAAKSVRVQMKVDFSVKNWPWQKPQWHKGMDYFFNYSEMPLATKEKFTMRMDQLIGKMREFSGGELDGERYIVFYLRLIRYSSRDGRYHTSNEWVRLQVDGFASISADTGYFDEDGNFVVDNDSEGSYSIKMDPNGKVIGGDKVPDEFLTPEEKLEVHEEDGWGVIERFIDSMKSFPAFMTRIFGFLPESLRWAVGAVFLTIVGLGVIALVIKILT